MSAINGRAMPLTVDNANEVLDQRFNFFSSEGLPTNEAFLPLWTNVEMPANGLLGRATKLHAEVSKLKTSEISQKYGETIKEARDQYATLQAMVVQANEIATQLLEMASKVDCNSQSSEAKPIIKVADITTVARQIQVHAEKIKETYLTRAYKTNPYWYLADYMRSFEKMMAPKA